MVFSYNDVLLEIKYDLESKINFSVFPGLQGGPHNHTISALATALKQANDPLFVEYQKQVVANAKVLVQRLAHHGFDIISGGTDNHLALVGVKSCKVFFSKHIYICS